MYFLIFQYLKHIDERSLGLSPQSITKTEVASGSALIHLSFVAALAINLELSLQRANQIFEFAVETRRILIGGGAAHAKHAMALQLAQILACHELDVDKGIENHFKLKKSI